MSVTTPKKYRYKRTKIQSHSQTTLTMARLLEEEEAVDFVDGNSWEVTELGPKK